MKEEINSDGQTETGVDRLNHDDGKEDFLKEVVNIPKGEDFLDKV